MLSVIKFENQIQKTQIILYKIIGWWNLLTFSLDFNLYFVFIDVYISAHMAMPTDSRREQGIRGVKEVVRL